MIAADQGIDSPGDRRGVEILRVKVEWRLLGIGLLLTARLLLFGCGRRFGRRLLADAMRKEVDDVQTGNTLLLKVIDRVGVLFAKDRHQHVSARDRLF